MKLIMTMLFGLFGLLQYALWFSDGGVLSAYRLQKSVKMHQQHRQQLVARNQLLLADIEGLKNGEEMVESHARYDLGMIRRGEVFYQIVQAE